MAKKKGIIKKVIIGATILLGLVGVTYTAVPQVKEAIDNTVDKIVEIFTGEERQKELEELQVVTNVNFDEKTRTLTFDENLKAVRYAVRVITKNGSNFAEIPGAVLKLPADGTAMTGDTVFFEITAIGDGINTKNSQKLYFEHTYQFANDGHYSLAKSGLENFLKKAINLGRIKGEKFDPLAFHIEGNKLTIIGIDISRTDNKFLNFSLEYDLTAFLEKNTLDFSNLLDYKALISYIANNSKHIIKVDSEYSAQYVDMTTILEQGGAFEEYTSQGYTIEVLQYSNSNVSTMNGGNYVIYKGVYRAVHESKPSITFSQENTVIIEGNKQYANVSQFVADALEAKVTTERNIEFDQLLNEHLVKTLAGTTENIITQNSQGIEQ